MLVGNLPHSWISDPHFSKEENNDTCESIYIQFRKSVFGTHFIDIPEMESIRTILVKAERGIKITGKFKNEIVSQMLTLHEKTSLEQLLSLIRILDLIQKGDYEVLASGNFSRKNLFKSDKMTRAHNYIMQNFKYDIDVNACAVHVGMTVTSFCRFFKKQTNVSFSVYLNYMRINLAQKLLINTQLLIKEIAFECGYVSIVYFNQKFKKMTGMSPNEFRGKRG
jgi:YesN/AraC family two-component response regulator